MKPAENRKVLQTGLLVIMAVAIFGNTFTNELVWDDAHLIKENHYLRRWKNIPLFFTPYYWNELHPSPGVYRPLRTCSLAVDYAFWQLNPVGYRLVNVLLHSVNVLLVYFLVSFIMRQETGDPGGKTAQRKRFFDAPFLTAALFATHPIHTESVNLVKNRSDLLAFMFFVISFLLFVKYLKRPERSPRWMLIAAWGSFIPALLSKEMALTLPGIVFLYAICFLPAPGLKKTLFRLVPYGVITLIYFWFMSTFIKAAEPLPAAPFPTGSVKHILTVIKTAGIYLKMLAAPYPLNADHAFTLPGSLSDPAVLTGLALLLLIGATAAGTYRRSPMVCFSLGWILLTLVPVANLVFLASRPIAEQRLYIPSLGFCLFLGYGLDKLSYAGQNRLESGRRVALSGILSALVLGAYAGLTVNRNADWRDCLTFYSQTLSANPNSARMHNNLGFTLSETGAYDEAISHYLEALRLQPDFIRALNNLGAALIETGRVDEGLQYHEAAFRLQPGRSSAWFSMGFALYQAGRYEEAVRHYETALRLQPVYLNACYNLGLALFELGRYEAAIDQYRAALSLAPDYVDAHINLGLALSAAHRSDEAVRQFLTAIALDPDSVEAYINLGVELSQGGRLQEAVQYYEAALALDPDCAQAWNNLGALLIKAGRFDEAVSRLTKAVRLKPDYSAALKNLGQALLLAGRVDESIGCFQAALNLVPDKADIYYHLGAAELSRGNAGQAAGFLEQALEMDPDHAKARQVYEECLKRPGPSIPGERP